MLWRLGMAASVLLAVKLIRVVKATMRFAVWFTELPQIRQIMTTEYTICYITGTAFNLTLHMSNLLAEF